MRTVLITGASSGIGFELAKLFARDQYTIVMVARDKDKLNTAAKELGELTSVHVVVADLATPNGAQRVLTAVQRLKLELDVLVNNAGFGTHGSFATANLKDELGMLDTNMRSLVSLTRLCLPGLIERKGKILNVASTAAFQPGPYMAGYYASKAFVLSFSEALAIELKGVVSVTTLCPGPTKTNFAARAGMQASRLFASNAKDASVVARAGYEGLRRHKRLVIPGLRNKILVFVERFAPRMFVLNMVSWINQNR